MTARLFLVTSLLVFVSSACRGPEPAPSSRPAPVAQASVLDQVARNKVLRIGYSGYPPYLNVDPATSKPKDGFSVDVIQRIITTWDPNIRIEWVPTNWTNVRVDLVNKKFDLIVEPVFRTIPRAAIVDFSRPYSYFGFAVGVVRTGDTRFRRIHDINTPQVKICVTQSATSHEFVKAHLPNATNLKVLPGGSVEASLDEVLLGRVDITLADLHTIRRYLAAHPGKLQAVFTDPPPARAPAGFMFRQDDYKWAAFLNTSLEYLDATGELQRLKAKYDVE